MIAQTVQIITERTVQAGAPPASVIALALFYAATWLLAVIAANIIASWKR